MRVDGSKVRIFGSRSHADEEEAVTAPLDAAIAEARKARCALDTWCADEADGPARIALCVASLDRLLAALDADTRPCEPGVICPTCVEADALRLALDTATREQDRLATLEQAWRKRVDVAERERDEARYEAEQHRGVGIACERRAERAEAERDALLVLTVTSFSTGALPATKPDAPPADAALEAVLRAIAGHECTLVRDRLFLPPGDCSHINERHPAGSCASCVARAALAPPPAAEKGAPRADR